MTFRLVWFFIVMILFSLAYSIANSAYASHATRMNSSCGAILAKGIPVKIGQILPGDLHFYQNWNFTAPEVDMGNQLKPQEQVWISDKSTHGMTCVATTMQAGWMPSALMSKSSREPSPPLGPNMLAGNWKRTDNHAKLVIISAGDDGLLVQEGEETCEGVCNHNAYAKNLSGHPAGEGVWVFKSTHPVPVSPAMRKIDPDFKPEACEIHARRIGKTLYVGDNRLCGGLNGTFAGTYHQ